MNLQYKLKLINYTTTVNRFRSTHNVFNQSAPLLNINLYQSDHALKDAITKFHGIDMKHLDEFGAYSGTEEVMVNADTAEKNKPVLQQFDNYGRRVDTITYHESYHKLMKHGIEHGCAGYGFKHNTVGSHITRAALIYMQNQIEPGHCCPIVMTAAAIPVLKRINGMEDYVDKILSQKYDPRNLPIQHKDGITLGMSMTEKQGGSDVRANTTIAVKAAAQSSSSADGNSCNSSEYLLTGHKWFTSAPMSDAFFTLAQTKLTNGEQGLSCFLVPRWLPDSQRNTGFQIQRLKDKLGDRANASSEVEYHEAWGRLIGEEGKGVKTIIEMVQSTRLDCALGSAGTARRGLQIALNHTNTRAAFGKKLYQQPLMSNLLTDLCIESEAHTMTAMYMAKAFDNYYTSPHKNSIEAEEERELFRIGVSVSKYYITKRLPGFIYECMEILGGNGYVEDFQMAKLFRQSPLNSIWEGSGNVIALDILRGHKALPVLLKDIKQAKGQDASFDRYIDHLEQSIHRIISSSNDLSSTYTQKAARLLVDQLAIALQASVLIRFGDNQVAEGYINSRIAHTTNTTATGTMMGHGLNYGGTCIHSDELCKYIVQRNMPVML